MGNLATSREVAEYLGVHPKSMDRWARTGQGPVFIRIGSARRYDWDDVRTWVESRKVKNQPFGGEE